MGVVDINRSVQIYKELINGRVINRYSTTSEGGRLENPLFTEIYSNHNDYKRQYQMAGFELVARPDFYYIRENNDEMPYTDPVKRIQATLLVISRHITRSGAMYEKLIHPMGGISDEDIAQIWDNPEYQEVLLAADVKDLATTVKSHMIERGIMEEPRPGRYILAPAGQYFFDELFSHGR
jgi:hypothetical protein